MIVTSLETIQTAILTLRERKPRIVVAIDGRGGAGKSTLAKKLVSKTEKSEHIEYDWFHLPKEKVVSSERYDHERIIEELLKPFLEGRDKCVFRRYNWGYLAGVDDGFHEIPTQVENKEVLIIEGCKLFHQKLLPFFDLRLWLNTPPEISMQRGIRRDIDEYKLDPEKVKSAWSEWKTWEEESLMLFDRSRCADLSVCTEDEKK